MLHCVLYIFLGGTAMISSGCALTTDTVAVDRIEYVQEWAPEYPVSGYRTYYSPPFVMWTGKNYQVRNYQDFVVRPYPRTRWWRYRSHPKRYRKGVYRFPGVHPYKKKVKNHKKRYYKKKRRK